MFSQYLHISLLAKNPASLHTHISLLSTSKGACCTKGGDPQGWNGHALPLISEHFSERGRQEVLLWPFKNKGIGHKG